MMIRVDGESILIEIAREPILDAAGHFHGHLRAVVTATWLRADGQPMCWPDGRPISTRHIHTSHAAPLEDERLIEDAAPSIRRMLSAAKMALGEAQKIPPGVAEKY
jgi:hypothetical protein